MSRGGLLLCAVIGLALSARPATGAARAEVALEPTSVTVGDRIAATLTVRLDAGDLRRPQFPDWTRGWGKLAVLDAPAATRVETPAGVEWRQRLELAAFEPGRLELPPLAIDLGSGGAGAAAPESVATPASIAVEVRSVLAPDADDAAPAGADPPRPLAVPRAFWWTAGTLTVLAAALALLSARRRPAADRSARALSPLAELEHALAALGSAEPAAAHAALSLALRRYLGRALSLPAAESTTTELAQRLPGRPLDHGTVQSTVRLLREVDQVKFARRPADADELAQRVESARGVAREIERALAPPAVESAA